MCHAKCWYFIHGPRKRLDSSGLVSLQGVAAGSSEVPVNGALGKWLPRTLCVI